MNSITVRNSIQIFCQNKNQSPEFQKIDLNKIKVENTGIEPVTFRLPV